MNDSRFYTIDGIPYPSVTTILKVLAIPALVPWAAKLAIEKGDADAWRILLKEAGESGTLAHAAAREAAQPGAYPNLPETPYQEAITAFFTQMKPKVLGTELVVVNKTHGYAGTLDLLAVIRGTKYVVDYKTSRAIYPDHALQVEAYRWAVPTENPLVSPPIADATAIVLLRKDGTFAFKVVEADFGIFLAAKRLWQWRETHQG